MASEFSNASLIARIHDKIDQTREALQRVVEAQNDDSDESNEDHIAAARVALDEFEGAVGDLVP